jgi:hypothetical protein
MGLDFFEGVIDAAIEIEEREKEIRRRQQRQEQRQRREEKVNRILDAVEGSVGATPSPKAEILRLKMRLAEVEESYGYDARKEARILKRKIEILEEEID